MKKICSKILMILLIGFCLLVNVKANTDYFEEIDIEILNEIIEMENSLVVFVGNDNDQEYQAYLEAYHVLYDKQDETIQSHFVKLNKDNLQNDSIEQLLSYAYKQEDRDTVILGINDMLNDTTGNSCIVYIYNKTITNAIKNSLDFYEDYDIKYVVDHDFYSNYRHSDINNNTYALQVNEDDRWVYNASARLQTFTAPISGTYHIKLWGATGDSDIGLKVESGPNTGKWSHGYGGGSGFSYADIELKEGQTIYLALGFRNNFSLARSYNGGGAGAPGYLGYRAGGGGAGSIYLSEKGNGSLSDYEQYQDEIIMVAAGGGGAEDYYHATWAYNPYPCSYEYCISTSGGNGGASPSGGISQGNVAETRGYMFGQGQDYNSYENASSGAGGGGLIGGLSADGNSIVLKGGSGAGGLSYINEKLTTNGVMKNGLNVTISCIGDSCFEDTTIDIDSIDENSTYAHDAGAIISLKEIKKHLLTINYLDIYDNHQLTASYKEYVKYQDDYEVISPDIAGYSVYDIKDQIIKGTMGDEDITIDVYYGYPGLFIYYQDYDTKETLADTYTDHLKIDSYYQVDSYDIDGYVRVDDEHDVISGLKKDKAEEFYVYYVPKVQPVKYISSINGQSVNDHVQLKNGDIVTYCIEIDNRRLVDQMISFEEHLPSSLRYLNSSIEPVSVINDVLSYQINAKARKKTYIYLDCDVICDDVNTKYIHNELWQNDQKVFETDDPFISYEIIKTSDPIDQSKVGYGQEITYNLSVINNGKNEVNNILVIDKIPENTSFSYIDRSYNGMMHDDNYVSFVIDSLLANSKITLSYKVKVTKKIEDNTQATINNIAYYDNLSEQVVDIDDLYNSIIENGKKTNEVIHYITGPKLSVVKTSDPISNSTVGLNDIIDYHITVTNESGVSANYLRIFDKIPKGTVYVEDSLELEASTDAKEKYAYVHGDNFDIHYDFVNQNFYLDNIGTIQTVNNNPIKALQIYYPSGLTISNEVIPDKWVKYDLAMNTIYFNIENNNAQSVIHDYLKSLRFAGTYGIKGEIRIDAFDTAMIARFDENGIIHFYKFVSSNNISFTNAKAQAATQFFGGLQGYLATITSQEEQDFLANSVATNSGWLGGSRINAYGSVSGNWEWINGPEKGQQFYTAATALNGGHALNGMYTNFNTGEPNASSHGDTYTEGCLQAFYQNGKWNDLTNEKHGAVLLGYYLEFSDGYNGYYLSRSKYITSLPTNSDNAGCKYISNASEPYVECITNDLEQNESVTMHFSVLVNDTSNIEHIDNIAYYDNYFDDPGSAGTLNNIPDQRSNMTIHFLNDKDPGVEMIKTCEPANGTMVNINDEITYKLNITNNGDISIKYLKIKDEIPNNSIYKLFSINQNGYFDGNSVNWIIEDLDVNESIELYFSVIVTKMDDTNTITNQALYDMFYEYPKDDEQLNFKSNIVEHFIYDVKDENDKLIIEVNKDSIPVNNSYINRNSEIEYQIKLTNNSENANANYVIVKDEIPLGTSFIEVLNDDIEYLFKDNILYYLIDVIKPKESVLLKFKVLVDKETTLKQIDNRAAYDILNTKVDLDEFEHDNYKSTNVVSHYLNDPVIELTKDSDPVSNSLIGKQRNISYSLLLENTSDTLANYVYVKDVIDERLELNSYSVKSSDPNDEITIIDNEIRWKVYDLESNGIHVLTYQAKVKNNVRNGEKIDNVAYYETSIKDKDSDPLNPSNVVSHYVETGVDVIQTGGNGYNMKYHYLMLCLCLIIIYRNKKC